MRISNKWRKMAEIYKQFSQMKRVPDAPPEHIKTWNSYDADRDFSEEAMLEAFEKESYGTSHPIRRNNGKINGYIEGKQWMDLTITEYWLPDLENKELFAAELYQDFPRWFLIKVIPERYHLSESEANTLYV
jgi:hypothetical protein